MEKTKKLRDLPDDELEYLIRKKMKKKIKYIDEIESEDHNTGRISKLKVRPKSKKRK